ncbi:MAG: HxsD-like protein [Myxococcota bacterium]|nr:HxsD-like protein [Myxococcota bacterium]
MSSRSAARSASRTTTAALQLDAQVYTAAALERARKAFAHLATIDVRRRGRQWTVRFSRIEPGVVDRLADEFANHALSCLLVDQ